MHFDAPKSVDELRDVLLDAHSSDTALRIVGSGTWLDAGREVRAAHQLSTRALSGVVDYVPGDLVITVRAGTTFAEIEAVTAAHDQWLALDPYVSGNGINDATVGATIATSSQGPLVLGYGRARDLILGLSFVAGNGTAVRAGGKVVKNVAGFDLVRLTTGAWGTLGVITEVNLRLHARPAVDETLAIALALPESEPARSEALDTLIRRLNSAPLLASTSSLAALLLLTHATTSLFSEHAPLYGSHAVLLARATGNRTKVDAIRESLSALGPCIPLSADVWRHVRSCDIGNTTFRVSDAPTRLAARWQSLSAWLVTNNANDARVILEPMRGVARLSCAISESQAPSLSLPSRAIAERLPAAAWALQPSPVDDQLAQRLRRTFDPAGILNPGIFGETFARMPV